jgi:putative DNA primase/helicase
MAQTNQKVTPIRRAVLAPPESDTQRDLILAKGFPQDDESLMLNVWRLIGADWRYVDEYKVWYHWNGKVWEKALSYAIQSAIRYALRSLGRDAWDSADDALIKQRSKFIASYMPLARRQTLEQNLREKLSVSARLFDSNPYLLVVQNGTIDLQEARQAQSLRDITLHPHRQTDFCTKLCNASFNPDATCPAWLAHMHFTTQGDSEYIAHKQRFHGACLAGEANAEVFIVAYGSGGNGKSKEFNAFAHMLGSYAQQLPSESLMRDNRTGAQASPDMMLFKGARAVYAKESDEGSQLADARVKALTGGDPITARGLHQDLVTFNPTHKLVLFTNHKPAIRDTSDGIWRRMRAWPYRAQAVENGTAARPGDVVRDENYEARLLAECDGILTWALDGYLAYVERGVGTCAAVQEATAAYRSTQDILGQFLADGYIQDIQGRILATTLYEDYQTWCTENGMRAATKQRLTERMQERGFTKERIGKARAWAWVGIRKVSAAGAQPQEAAAPAQPKATASQEAIASAAATGSAALLDDLTGGA